MKPLKNGEMPPLRHFKTIQVLTDESVFQIRRAVAFLEVFNETQQNKLVNDNIAKLKELIEEIS